MGIKKNGLKPIVKKNIDISKVSIPKVRAKLTKPEFIAWAKSHGYTGDLEKAYSDLQPEKEVKAETKK